MLATSQSILAIGAQAKQWNVLTSLKRTIHLMKRRISLALILLTLFALGIVAALALASRQVPQESPRQAEGARSFPILEGTNLLLAETTVPDDLPGTYRLIVVAYDSDQQTIVNKWLIPLEALVETYPDLRGYYVPLLPLDTADAALPIIGGMTLAATNDTDRARTVVVFTDVLAFNTLVGVEGVEEVQLFLLDTSGAILWQGAGSYSPATLASLEAALSELTGGG